MTMLIHCPSCQTALHVPVGSSGRPARCPSCKNKFAVPHPKQIMEDTVAAWLVSDFMSKEVEEEREDDDELLKELSQLDDLQLDDDLADDHDDQTDAPTPIAPPATVTQGRATTQAPTKSASAKGTDVSLPAGVPVTAQADAAVTNDAPSMPEPVLPMAAAAAPVMPSVAPPPSFYSAPTPAPAPGPVTAPDSPNTTTPAASDQPTAATSTDAAVAAAAVATGAAAGASVPAANTAATVTSSPSTTDSPAVKPNVVVTAVAVKPHRPAETLSTIFPTDIAINGPRPHLAVLEINQSGVKFAFDSIWLDQAAFRASMPMRGVFGGNNTREDLRARPMVWADRSGAVIRSITDVETRYEQPLLANWNHRDIINAMGIIEGLPRPFCNPMPYFVDKYHLNMSLTCSTFKRPDGGLTCEVTIANGDVALEWLRNVNGMCGPEFEALQRELQIIHSDRWALLPEQVRQRVTVWCRFQTRERFQLYLNDAEMSIRDAGLAGLVVTDRRMIYHKFHHNGQVDLASPGTLIVKKIDETFQLFYEGWNMPGHRVKLVKLKADDVTTLTTTLAAHPTLQVQQAG